MQRDLKIGLSLGVLLVGVVGALFNRRESITETASEPLQSAQQLDERIAEKGRKPYLTTIEVDDAPQSKPQGKRPALRQKPPRQNSEPDQIVGSGNDARASAESVDIETPTSENFPPQERNRSQPGVANAVIKRLPSAEPLSVTSTGLSSNPATRQVDDGKSTVPPPESLEPKSPGSEVAEKAPSPKASRFKRAENVPFIANGGGNPDSKPRSNPAKETRDRKPEQVASAPVAKRNRAKTGVEKDARTPAATPAIKTPSVYKVIRGDSLDKIATKIYGDSSKAKAIYEENRAQLKSPSDLRVGMQLKLP